MTRRSGAAALAALAALAITPASVLAQAAPVPPPPAPAAVGSLDYWVQCRAAAGAVADFLGSRRVGVTDPAQLKRLDEQLAALRTIEEGSRQGIGHMNKQAKLADPELARRHQAALAPFKRPDGLRSAAGVLESCQAELVKRLE